jgi:hypothetical protein
MSGVLDSKIVIRITDYVYLGGGYKGNSSTLPDIVVNKVIINKDFSFNKFNGNGNRIIKIAVENGYWLEYSNAPNKPNIGQDMKMFK